MSPFLSYSDAQYPGQPVAAVAARNQEPAPLPRNQDRAVCVPAIVLPWRTAKTQQPSLLAAWLNSVTQVAVALHHQHPTCCKLDAYFYMRRMPVRKL